MTKKDIDDIIKIVCPNDADFERPIISPKYLKQELEQIALEQESSNDLISRQAIIDAIDKWVKNRGVLITLPTSEVIPLFESIHELPPVNPQEPKTGHWIMHKKHRECSECNVYLPKDMPRNSFCPNCGARMESEEE